MDRSETNPATTLALAVSAGEKKLIENVALLNPDVVAAVQQSRKQSVQLSIGQLDDLADALSGEANHTEDTVLQGKLDTFVRTIDRLTGSHLLAGLETKGPDVQRASSLKSAIGNQKTKPLRGTQAKMVKRTLAVTLSPAQREILENACPRKSLQRRLQGDGLRTIEFTHREFEYLHDRARIQAASASTRQKKRLLNVCNKIGKILGEPQLVQTRTRQSADPSSPKR